MKKMCVGCGLYAGDDEAEIPASWWHVQLPPSMDPYSQPFLMCAECSNVCKVRDVPMAAMFQIVVMLLARWVRPFDSPLGPIPPGVLWFVSAAARGPCGEKHPIAPGGVRCVRVSGHQGQHEGQGYGWER